MRGGVGQGTTFGMTDKPPRPAPITRPGPADPAVLNWGTVTLLRGPLSRIAGFAAWHLSLGAARVTLYLDDPDPAQIAYLDHPRVTLIPCTPQFWAGLDRPRPDAHQRRQALVATDAYRDSAGLNWLAHIDMDEFLLPETSVAETLAAAPPDLGALVMNPAEQLAGPPPERFKLAPRHVGKTKSLLPRLYPTFGQYLRGGFISHLEGKLFARTGIERFRLGIHGASYRGHPIENRTRTTGIWLGHAHAPDWDTFQRHMGYRLTKGSYRNPQAGGLPFSQLLDMLAQEGALRAFYDEVCSATPHLVAALQAEGMLITRPLDLPAKIADSFGPLPKDAQ